MSFKRFNNSFEKENEIGLVYTRDKYGCVKVPSGYGLNVPKRMKSHQIDTQLQAASCSTIVDGKASPVKLFLICLDFVAKNITMVESLCGFPDIVGKELFDRVESCGGFTSSSKYDILQLFCDAYGRLVLDSLDLSGQYLAVQELDYLQYFPCLSELDLSHCRLGSSHELLLHVAKMHSLVRVSLKDNCLQDSDLKQLTLPLRVMGVGPCLIAFLDLSCNPGLTDMSVRHLTCFKHLTGLNLSCTSVTVQGGVAKLTRETTLGLSTNIDSGNKIETQGWAASVILNWLSASNQPKVATKHDTTNKKVVPFYVKRKKGNILKAGISQSSHKHQEKLVILRTRKNVCIQTLGTRTTDLGKSIKNCKKSTFSCMSSSQTKRKEFTSDVDMDDVMQGYLESTANVCNKKRKICLGDLIENSYK